MTSSFDEINLEGWLLLEKTAVILDFHSMHRRAGRSAIPYSAIERAEVLPIIQSGGLFRSARVTGTVVRMIRFDRYGFQNNPSADVNKMFIPHDAADRFSYICQEIMERAAMSLPRTAGAELKVATGMFKKTNEGTLEPRGVAKVELEAIDGIAGIVLGSTTIAKGNEVYPLRRVHAHVSAYTAEGPYDRRTTATRVITGAAVAGRTGAVVGAIAKKRVPGQKTRAVRIQVTGPGFEWNEEIHSTDETKGRQLAAEINGRSSK